MTEGKVVRFQMDWTWCVAEREAQVCAKVILGRTELPSIKEVQGGDHKEIGRYWTSALFSKATCRAWSPCVFLFPGLIPFPSLHGE